MAALQILDQDQIEKKIKRMAYEIWEANAGEEEVTVLGIEGGGAIVAQNLCTYLKKISPLKVNYESVRVDKKNIVSTDVILNSHFENKTIVLVDDVANSGKTLLYTIKPLLNEAPKRIIVAVLVDRNHKNFPISADIKGHTVLTTLQDHIVVSYEGKQLKGVFLE